MPAVKKVYKQFSGSPHSALALNKIKNERHQYKFFEAKPVSSIHDYDTRATFAEMNKADALTRREDWKSKLADKRLRLAELMKEATNFTKIKN